jgi:hypothetical protein
MRKNHFLLMLMVFMILLSAESYAQRLIIKMHNGNENSEQLATIQKLYFSNNQIIVDFKTGSDDSYALTDVRKLYFDASVSISENPGQEGKLSIYPNPANTVICIDGIPSVKGMLRIFRMDGSLVVNREITSDHETFDVSTLPDGLYLINIAGLTSKFVKK